MTSVPPAARLSIIVAMTEERVIGKNNQLPWHISEDLKRFKKITMGHPIIMGRKTFESIGKPLPGRQNIVLTGNPSYQKEGITVVHSFEEALRACGGSSEQFVIGGAALFKAALPKADRIYLTRVHQKIEGDTYFPPVDIEKQFSLTEKSEPQKTADGSLTYTFLTADKFKI